MLVADGATFAKGHRPVKLRNWQAKATEACVLSYKRTNRKVWVTEACTGAGKTRHGCEVAAQLLAAEMVDLVIVLTPTIATKTGWKESLGKVGRDLIQATDDTSFPVDTNTWVSTYGGLESIKDALKERTIRKGILLLVDEYHHAEEEATWGKAVATLGAIAKHALLLSGTPWRRNGFIPLLNGEVNSHGEPYYKDESTRVNADFVHDYKADLREGGDRATTLVYFDLMASVFTNAKDGKQEQLLNPDFKEMTDEEIAEWEEAASKCATPLGKHVRIKDPTLADNKLAKEIISWCVGKLAVSREAAYRSCGQRDLTVMLLVAQSVGEARLLANYVQEMHGLRTEVVVSEDERSNERLEGIRQKCKENAADKPDVIVSVGMVSEGVDIPQIKVIGYLSAILTTLYLVQVIGRELRRISTGDNRYADQGLHDTVAYFAAPAHPKICYVAKKIEEKIADCLAASGGGDGGGDEGPKPEPVKGTVDITGDHLGVLRGQVGDDTQWHEVIEAMRDNPRAADCFLDSAWCEYVLGLALRGDRASADRAQELAHEMCGCLGVEFDQLWGRVSSSADSPISYDQEQRLLRKQAQYLTNLIRWRCKPFSEIDENERAYMEVRSFLNRASGIAQQNLSFPKASLVLKKKWINCAQALLEKGGSNEL